MNLNYFQTLIWLPKKTLNFHEVLEYLEDLKASSSGELDFEGEFV